MSGHPKDRVERAQRIVDHLDQEMREAIAINAVYRSAWFSDKVPRALSPSYAIHTLRVLRNSLLCTFVMTLMRMYDDSLDTASLHNLKDILRDPEVQEFLHKARKVGAGFGNRSPIAGLPIDEHSDLYAVEFENRDRNAVAIADSLLEAMRHAIAKLDEIEQHKIRLSLGRLRDRVLAHKQLSPGKHGTKLGYPCELLTQTLEVFEALSGPVDTVDRSYPETGKHWKEYSDDFWDRLLPREVNPVAHQE
jgi:hypothetical protein